MATCNFCAREIKNYGVFLGGIRCHNNCTMINKRGKPDDQGPNSYVHLYKELDSHPDYFNVLCNNGSYHLWYTEDVEHVTCPACLERAQKP